MNEMKKIEQVGTEAVKQLRLKKLQSGHHFMINSKELPAHQCYLEYPDGSIVLATLSKAEKDFDIVRTLTTTEQQKLREKYSYVLL